MAGSGVTAGGGMLSGAESPAWNREPPVAKNEKTSPGVASKASKILSNPKSSKAEKSVAASALTQAKDKPKGKK